MSQKLEKTKYCGLTKMSCDHDILPSRMRDANEAQPTATPAAQHLPHHHHKHGGIWMDVQLIREVAAMITNIRNITNQNLAMQKLLMQMQGQEGHLIPLYRSQGQYL